MGVKGAFLGAANADYLEPVVQVNRRGCELGKQPPRQGPRLTHFATPYFRKETWARAGPLGRGGPIQTMPKKYS